MQQYFCSARFESYGGKRGPFREFKRVGRSSGQRSNLNVIEVR